ncbi:hypothetical protein ABZ636_39340 [Streptomyces sp. NPDC007251]|uniref:hypothetical protein n=1 Tax=Streptomyces sp. NPDC007251 TaxID=3154483 RepID=UPI0033DBDF86
MTTQTRVLQDPYGVRPDSIARATSQDAYFASGTAHQLMRKLTQRPDNLLVSVETVNDFQLSPGDTVNLRIQDARTKALRTVPFHYAGIAKEFPTPPRTASSSPTPPTSLQDHRQRRGRRLRARIEL